MISSLVSAFATACALSVGTALVGWILSYAAFDGRESEDGITHLEFTPALHVYGALMSLIAITSLVGLGSTAFVGSATGVVVALVAVPLFVMSVWGLYAGYGGRLSYNSEGVFYRGLKTKVHANWGEVSAVHDGDFAQFLVIGGKRLVVSKGLRGFQAFANEAHRRGVLVDDTLR